MWPLPVGTAGGEFAGDVEGQGYCAKVWCGVAHHKRSG